MNTGQFLALKTFGLSKVAYMDDRLRNALLYSAIAAPTGGLVGAGTGLLQNSEDQPNNNKILRNALIGAGIGLGTGGLLGASTSKALPNYSSIIKEVPKLGEEKNALNIPPDVVQAALQHALYGAAIGGGAGLLGKARKGSYDNQSYPEAILKPAIGGALLGGFYGGAAKHLKMI